MKKRLIAGVGIITLIFTISGIFIFENLRVIISEEELRDAQDKVLDSYDYVMVYLRSAQAELYRHEAGYSRDIDGLAENVLKTEDALAFIKRGYESLDAASCNNCHEVGPKIAAFQTRLDHASDHLQKYEEKISLIATAGDVKLSESWENEAAEEGNRLLDIIAGAAEAAARMNRHLDKLQMLSLRRSGLSIFAAIILSSLSSLVVIVLLIRSIRGGLNGLIKGIERVSSGNYGSKVDVVTDDELGFLAKTFNAMTDNLQNMTRQRDFLEEELRQLNAGLERRVSEARKELKNTHEQMLRTETLSAVGTLASGVAHELATPLSSIINYVQMIRRRTGDGERLAGEMSIIENELVRCREILRGMLVFIRPPQKEKMLTDINSVMRDMIELIRYRAKSFKVSIKQILDPSLPPVTAVPGQLKQVFMNIMVNALDSMPAGGEITVSTSLKDAGRKIAVSISDTGCGIPERDLNSIFEPFFTNKKSGTGLGLSISYGIVKGHGGDLEVESEEGRGTTFHIYLPTSTVGAKNQGVESSGNGGDSPAVRPN